MVKGSRGRDCRAYGEGERGRARVGGEEEEKDEVEEREG